MDALAVWLSTRAGLALLVLAGSWQLSGRDGDQVSGWLSRWQRWDTDLFRKIAEFGYAGRPTHYRDAGVEAFFPGLPLVLALVHRVVPSWTAAGLLVSLVAGGVAAVFLARLAELDGAPGGRAVLYLALSPYAVFLAAGYSESLFLCFALPGWWCAKNRSWRAAALLVAGACTVRVNGLFLAVALVVEYSLAGPGGRRRRTDALWLTAPFATLFAYSAYLYALTGDWLRWLHAQAQGWDRQLTAPWTALARTYGYARDLTQGAEYVWSWWAEIAAVAVGVGVTVVLLARRRWGEAVYLGLSVGALATSTYYLSVSRATLLWFPVWLLLARVATRRPAVHTAYVALAAPLAAVAALTFTAGRWVG